MPRSSGLAHLGDWFKPCNCTTTVEVQTARLLPIRAVSTSLNPELGSLIKIYRGRQIGWGALLSLCIGGSAAVLTPLAYGLWQANYGYTQFGPAAAAAWSRPWYFLASLASLALIVLAWLRVRDALLSVAVHQGGLVLSPAPIRKIKVTWQELEGLITSTTSQIFLGFQLDRRTRLKLLRYNHSPVLLDDRIQKLEELSLEIKRRVYPGITSRLSNALEDGQEFSFGPLTLTPGNMRLQNREITMSQIEAVKIASGFLVVELGAAGRMSVPLARIPNPEVLIDHLQKTANGQQ